MFNKKPIRVVHEHVLEIPDLEAAAAPVLDRLTHMGKTVLIVLGVGIPAVILFAFAARVGAEVAVDHLTAPPEFE